MSLEASADDSAVSSLHVIGIGASAGGLEATRSLLCHLARGVGHAAIILAQHLSPTHNSKLTEILSRQHGIRVLEAVDGQLLEANTLYVTPEDRDITLEDGRVRLTRPADAGSKPSVDTLFISLAREKQELAVGVILSGSGCDGAEGIRAIHQAGGITLVQDPDTAQSCGMPQAAIATGCVDRVLQLEQLGQALHHLVQPAPLPEDGPAEPKAADHGVSQALSEVFLRLSRHSGIDFKQYKLPTLFRRFQKRLAQLGLADAEAYLHYLDAHPDEPEQLFRLMLIGVTRFHRDPQAFAGLETHLADMVKAKGPKQPIRIWVPGCSTGEEAYTLAFYFCRLLQERWHDCELQIFASDLDDRAIAQARRGIYPAAALAALPEDLIARCFDRQDDHYEVKHEIRAKILFTRHDITGNPPFLKLDLISCRNLLIYFTPALQQQLLPIFHYALNPDGYLFLGKSESIGDFADLFEVLDPEQKIFRRRQGSQLRRMQFSHFKLQTTPSAAKASSEADAALSLGAKVKETLFASFEHPYAVINDGLDVLEISGDVRLYLGVGEGQPTTNLLRLIQPELQIDLMAVITRAQRERAARKSPVCRFAFFGQTHFVRFYVKPLLFTGKGQDQYLVVFEAIDPAEQILPPSPASAGGTSGTENAELRHELETVRIQLQNYIEQLETSNQELQALNEEQLSTNEEFQSTNEELETSHEELQSTYEEVQAAYVELQASNDALEASQSRLRKAEANVWALLNNTLQAFMLVDKQGEIVSFNQAASQIFQQLSGKQLVQGLAFSQCLPTDSREFFLSELGLALAGELRSGEKPALSHLADPLWLAYSFTPAQADNLGNQAVSVSLLDISERVFAQEALLAQAQRFKALIEHSFDGIAVCEKFGIFSYVSPSIERMLGYATDEMLLHHSSEFIHPDDLAVMGRIFSSLLLEPAQASQMQWRQRHKNGDWRWLEGVAVNSLDVPGVEGTILNFRDITGRRQQEQALRLSESRLRQIIDLIPAYIYARDSQNRCLLANAMTARLFGLSPQELEGRSLDSLEGDLPENAASLQADRDVREQSVIRILPEFRFETAPDRAQLLRSFKIPYTSTDSGHPATLTVAMDITGFRAAETQAR